MVIQQTVLGEQVIPGKRGSALVASRSAPGSWYLTTTTSCECLAGQHGRTCRHLRAVRSFFGLDDVIPTSNGVDDGEYISFQEWKERRAAGREW